MDRMLAINGELINLKYVKKISCSSEKCYIVIRNTQRTFDTVQYYFKRGDPESYSQLKKIVDTQGLR